MPITIAELFASTGKAERTDSRSEALSLLYIELLRMLISKGILSADEVQEVFSNAAGQSLSSGPEIIEGIYELLTEQPNMKGDDSKNE